MQLSAKCSAGSPFGLENQAGATLCGRRCGAFWAKICHGVFPYVRLHRASAVVFVLFSFLSLFICVSVCVEYPWRGPRRVGRSSGSAKVAGAAMGLGSRVGEQSAETYVPSAKLFASPVGPLVIRVAVGMRPRLFLAQVGRGFRRR